MSQTLNGAYVVKTVGEAWTIVHATARDHANRIMRAAGRKAWSADDADGYRADLHERLNIWGFLNGDRPTPIYLAMCADKSAPFVIAAQVSA